MTTIITRTTARIVVPIILVTAISLFLQGHNAPGGGFIGGVLTVAAFALVYIAYDLDYLEIDVLDRNVEDVAGVYVHRTVTSYRHIFLFGLVVTITSGVAGFMLGGQFLAQTFWHFKMPLFGDVELASALLFDVGIYCIVVGGLLSILSVVGAE